MKWKARRFSGGIVHILDLRCSCHIIEILELRLNIFKFNEKYFNTLEEAKEEAIKEINKEFNKRINQYVKDMIEFNELIQDPIIQFACAILNNDPIAIDAVKDILKC